MVDYRKLKFNSDLSAMTDDDYRAWQQAFAKADADNDALWRAALKKHQALCQSVLELYGARSRQFAYFKREVPNKPTSHRNEATKLRRNYEAELGRRQKREYERDRRRRAEETAELLENIGYEEDVHFRKSNAITFAKQNLTATPDGRRVPMLPDKTQGDER